MFSHIITFIFGAYIAQEYKLPNIKKTTQDFIERFKK